MPKIVPIFQFRPPTDVGLNSSQCDVSWILEFTSLLEQRRGTLDAVCVCTLPQRPSVRTQLDAVSKDQKFKLVVVPECRGSAASLALIASLPGDPDDLLLLVNEDGIRGRKQALVETLDQSIYLARDTQLITVFGSNMRDDDTLAVDVLFGAPIHSSFGYMIQSAARVNQAGEIGKDPATLRRCFSTDMFLVRRDLFTSEVNLHARELANVASLAGRFGRSYENVFEPDLLAYLALPHCSMGSHVLPRTERAAVVPLG